MIPNSGFNEFLKWDEECGRPSYLLRLYEFTEPVLERLKNGWNHLTVTDLL